MNGFSQILVELTWSLTMGILVIAGVLAAQAIGLAIAATVVVTLAWKCWTAWSRRHR